MEYGAVRVDWSECVSVQLQALIMAVGGDRRASQRRPPIWRMCVMILKLSLELLSIIIIWKISARNASAREPK